MLVKSDFTAVNLHTLLICFGHIHFMTRVTKQQEMEIKLFSLVDLRNSLHSVLIMKVEDTIFIAKCPLFF